MSMDGPPLAAIRADGVLIPLADGNTVPLRYSMAALAAIEVRFGNIVKPALYMQAALADLTFSTGQGTEEDLQAALAQLAGTTGQGAQEGRYTGPGLMGVLLDALAPGMPPGLRDREVLGEALHPGYMRQYVQAYNDATGQSFDTGQADIPTDPTNPPQGSPGASGTTSSAGSTGAPTTSSGT